MKDWLLIYKLKSRTDQSNAKNSDYSSSATNLVEYKNGSWFNRTKGPKGKRPNQFYGKRHNNISKGQGSKWKKFKGKMLAWSKHGHLVKDCYKRFGPTITNLKRIKFKPI